MRPGEPFVSIVFDCDGVLIESIDIKTRAFADLYRPYGEEIVTQVVAYHLAHGGISRLEKFRHFHSKLLGLSLSTEEEQKLSDRFSFLVEDEVVEAPWVIGAKEFLDAHWMCVPLYLVSATPTDELLRIIDRRKMSHYFRGVFGSPASKAEILKSLITKYSVQPTDMLMVGDALTDYVSACSVGMPFIGRFSGVQSNPFPTGVTVITNLLDLQTSIDQMR